MNLSSHKEIMLSNGVHSPLSTNTKPFTQLTALFLCSLFALAPLQASAKTKFIRQRASRELKSSTSTASNNWVKHAATITPFIVDHSSIENKVALDIAVSLQPYTSSGVSMMDSLKDFSLKTYRPSALFSARLSRTPYEPIAADLFHGLFLEVAYGQQDGSLPLTSSSQGGSIRLHHIFLELGSSLTWKPKGSPRNSFIAGAGFGQHTSIQSSSLSQARYSSSRWHYSWFAEALYLIRPLWTMGIGFKSRAHIQTSSSKSIDDNLFIQLRRPL